MYMSLLKVITIRLPPILLGFKTIASMYGVEISTEAITELGQYNVRIEAGLSTEEKRSFTSPKDVGQSFKDVAGTTAVLVTMMAGGGTVAGGDGAIFGLHWTHNCP